jgi:hypothetical protein
VDVRTRGFRCKYPAKDLPYFFGAAWGKNVSVGTILAPLPTISFSEVFLKGLSHEIFTFFSLLELIYLGLNMNRFWFVSFKVIPSILYSKFKY